MLTVTGHDATPKFNASGSRSELPLAFRSTQRLQELRRAVLSKAPVSLGLRRTESPHEFYRYPARFSPGFARAAILAFTHRSDMVLDPFVGGGTTLIESMRLGRRSIGADINELATFVSKVKSTVLDEVDAVLIARWAKRIGRSSGEPSAQFGYDWNLHGYLKDLDWPTTAPLRVAIGDALDSVLSLRQEKQRDFARAIILRTAQWALDMRSDVPSLDEFQEALSSLAVDMIAAAQRFSDELNDNYFTPTILTQASPGISSIAGVNKIRPKLILTSPPYPGVYVNYHRWKLMGRREIAAPYWIADCRDGMGLASYTMRAKSGPTFDRYFESLLAAFSDLRRMASHSTWLVQMVGFNHRASQLPRYLETMAAAGFSEVIVPLLATEEDGRLWRDVPGRRWWSTTTTRQPAVSHTAKEVVLIYRATKTSS